MLYSDIKVMKTNPELAACKTLEEIEKLIDFGEMWLTGTKLIFDEFANDPVPVTLEELKNTLLKAIRIDRTARIETHIDDKEYFLKNIFSFTNNYHTYLINKEKEIISVCCADAYRSILDLYLLTKTYFKDTTLREVYTSILSNPDVGGHRCQDVDRIVYANDLDRFVDYDDDIFEMDFEDELGVGIYKKMVLEYDDYYVICTGVDYSINK